MANFHFLQFELVQLETDRQLKNDQKSAPTSVMFPYLHLDARCYEKRISENLYSRKSTDLLSNLPADFNEIRIYIAAKKKRKPIFTG
jgi:hypothetical protein